MFGFSGSTFFTPKTVLRADPENQNHGTPNWSSQSFLNSPDLTTTKTIAARPLPSPNRPSPLYLLADHHAAMLSSAAASTIVFSAGAPLQVRQQAGDVAAAPEI